MGDGMPYVRLHNITNTLAGWWRTSDDLMPSLEAGQRHLFELGESPLGPLTGLIQVDRPVVQEPVCSMSDGYGRVMRIGGGERTLSHQEIWTAAYLTGPDRLYRVKSVEDPVSAAKLRPLLMDWITGTARELFRLRGHDFPETLELQDSQQCPTCPSYVHIQCRCREYSMDINGIALQYGGGFGGTMGQHPGW